jgi:hypothetical protein
MPGALNMLTTASGINLKLAIDEGLDRQQNGLIASFMQTLVMSEGETVLWFYFFGGLHLTLDLSHSGLHQPLMMSALRCEPELKESPCNLP